MAAHDELLARMSAMEMRIRQLATEVAHTKEYAERISLRAHAHLFLYAFPNSRLPDDTLASLLDQRSNKKVADTAVLLDMSRVWQV